MGTALWIVSGLLSLIFLASGTMKLAQPRDTLVASGMEVLEDFSAGTVKGVGILEVLAAGGLILPAAVDVAPILVPLAATGLALLMVGAIITHLRRGEIQTIVVNVALLALSVLVAWGRFGPVAFTS